MNYYATERKVTETVLFGTQPFRVEAIWRIEEDDEQKIDVRIYDEDGKMKCAYLGLEGSTALLSFAEVFLTLDRLISTEAVDAARYVP